LEVLSPSTHHAAMATMLTLLATQPAACKPSVHAGRSLPCCVHGQVCEPQHSGTRGTLHETFKPTYIDGMCARLRRSERALIVATTGSNEHQPPHHTTTPALSGHRVGGFACSEVRRLWPKVKGSCFFFRFQSPLRSRQTTSYFFYRGRPKRRRKKAKTSCSFLAQNGSRSAY
jgi:hypothetical protein